MRKLLKIVGWTLGGGVVAVLAFLGLQFLVRGTPLSYVSAFGERGAPGVGDAEFAESLSLLTPVALGAARSIEVYGDGDATFRRLWSDMRSATRTLTVEIYYAKPGAVADSLAAILESRARAGVSVLFLYDAFGAGPLDAAYLERLRGAGVSVAEFRPVRWYSLHKAQQRAHVRAIVIDGRVGWTGGLGIADNWLGHGRRRGSWRDTNVRFAGAAARQLQAAFVQNWVEATGQLLTGDLFLPPPDPAGPEVADSGMGRAGLVHSAPSLGSTIAERLLALSIAGARNTLFVTNAYFVPDDDFRRLLVQAARRGVDVRVLVPGAHTDVSVTRYAGRSHYEELLRGGVRIYEYQPTMLHAKTLVADGRLALVGTMNFDNRSLALNNEAVLVALDTGAAESLDSLFSADLAYAREISLDAFQRRSWVERLRERGSVILSRLL